MREALGNFIPVVAARGVVNLSGLLDVWLAGLLASGAVTMLSFAYAIYLLPISLFWMSIAASELPELSRQRGAEPAAIAQRISTAMERVAFFVVPSTVALLLFGREIVGIIYETGAFGPDQARVTWAVLAAYSLGLLASTRSRLLTSAFFALRDARTPARIAYLRVTVSAAVGVSLMFYFDGFASGAVRYGVVGLGLGATLGAWVEYVALRRALRHSIGSHRADLGRSLRVWSAAAGSALLGIGAMVGLPPASELGLLWIPGPVVHGLGTLLPFGVAYLGLTHLFGVSDPLRSALGISANRKDR